MAKCFYGMTRAWVVTVYALLLLGGPLFARTTISLDGTWQMQKVSALSYPPPATGWQDIAVPGFLTGWQYEHAWYRRGVLLPNTLSNQVLTLQFRGVKFDAQIYLNGSLIGRYLNGYEPFEIDVSSLVRLGVTNELVVGVTDWTATFAGPIDFSGRGPNEDPRNYVRNNIQAPIGGRYDQYGLWQSVFLTATPTVAIDDVFVIPSVRSQTLTARVTVRNAASVDRTASLNSVVTDAGQTALTLPGRSVTLPARSSRTFDLTSSWTNAHYWSHVDPHLYSLTTTITDGSIVDTVPTRFGFREFWTENGGFRLNGIPINLLATASWPPDSLQSTQQIRKVLLDVKAGNNVAIRFHTQPWDEPWYDIADEVGLLVVEECAVWCDPFAYQLSAPAFWTNYTRHLEGAVRRDRNHPSIILWSLENEILHCGGEQAYASTDVQLAAMGRVVKQNDPTRPITFEADLDPGGEAHVLGLHYPHEFPDYQLWPNTARWMDQSIPRDWVPGGQWRWDRTKPLYIGEFLWVDALSPKVFTILHGDDAYLDPVHYRVLSKAMTWRMQIEAYRSYGVNGMGPWTLFEDPATTRSPFDLQIDRNLLYQAQKEAYHPFAVFSLEYHTRFFSGDSPTRTVTVYNDGFADGNFTLRWRVDSGPWQEQSFPLASARRVQKKLPFTVPTSPGPFLLSWELLRGGELLFSNAVNCVSMLRANLELPTSLRWALYDPVGSTASLLHRMDLTPSLVVSNLATARLDNLDLLIVGANALTNSRALEIGNNDIGSNWRSFAQRGGWVIVLEQTNYPSWMPGSVRLTDAAATFTFPEAHHPAMFGLTFADTRWWADDNLAVRQSISLPVQGNLRAIATIGSKNGLTDAAALEIPIESGGILCSQWLLTERFDREPIARVLWQRLFDYVTQKRSDRTRLKPIALVAEPTSGASGRMATLGIQMENVSGHVAQIDPSFYSALMLAGGTSVWQEATAQLPFLTQYVNQGGTLVLHRPSEAFLTAARSSLLADLEHNDTDLGSVLRRDTTNAVVHIPNVDLYWIDLPEAYNQPEVLSSNIAHRVYHRRFNLTSFQTLRAEAMPIRTVGAAANPGWLLWANGYLAQTITIPESGTYQFRVTARGSSALGGWPKLTAKFDGRAEDSIVVNSAQNATYSFSAELTAGAHEFALEFDNDLYAPPEDRNLWVIKTDWGRSTTESPAELLTRPGALAQVRRGKGTLLLDEIAWDDVNNNKDQANRYLRRFITELGGSILPANPLVIEAESMTNVNVSAYGIADGLVSLNSAGRVETRVRATSSGVYTLELIAGGTPAAGVLPQLGITIDGVTATNFFLTTPSLNGYTFRVSLSAGLHTVGLVFLNDLYAPPEDRNAVLDRFSLTPEPLPRLITAQADSAQHLPTIQWEALPGRSYEIQRSKDLAAGSWEIVTTRPAIGNVVTWTDSTPLSSNDPTRFYRLRLLP